MTVYHQVSSKTFLNVFEQQEARLVRAFLFLGFPECPRKISTDPTGRKELRGFLEIHLRWLATEASGQHRQVHHANRQPAQAQVDC